MLVTELGMAISVRPEQYSNAPFPILVTELGITTFVSPPLRLNAHSPIVVTELGMVISVRPTQKKKDSSPIQVTVLGTTVFLHPAINVFVAFSIMALHPPLESYTSFASSTTILDRVGIMNGFTPILVTELGMVIFVIPSHK